MKLLSFFVSLGLVVILTLPGLAVEDAPVADTPVEDVPVADTPVEDASVADTPVEDSPVADTPVEDSPVADTPVEDAPVTDSGGDNNVVVVPDDFVLVGDEVISSPLDSDSPIEVIVVPDPDGVDYPSLFSSSVPGLVISDTPPANSPFYGSGWVTGTDSRLGTVTLYFPIDYQAGHWGVDSNGYLFNVTSSTMSGYLSGVYNNSVSASSFDYPRYRDGSTGDWTYYDLHLVPTDSNMDIAVEHVPRVPVSDVLPYFLILLVGGCMLCFMKRS